MDVHTAAQELLLLLTINIYDSFKIKMTILNMYNFNRNLSCKCKHKRSLRCDCIGRKNK